MGSFLGTLQGFIHNLHLGAVIFLHYYFSCKHLLIKVIRRKHTQVRKSSYNELPLRIWSKRNENLLHTIIFWLYCWTLSFNSAVVFAVSVVPVPDSISSTVRPNLLSCLVRLDNCCLVSFIEAHFLS